MQQLKKDVTNIARYLGYDCIWPLYMCDDSLFVMRLEKRLFTDTNQHSGAHCAT